MYVEHCMLGGAGLKLETNQYLRKKLDLLTTHATHAISMGINFYKYLRMNTKNRLTINYKMSILDSSKKF